MVEDTSRKNYLYDTVNEAIEAENDSLIRRYASQNNKLLSRVKAEVANDSMALTLIVSVMQLLISTIKTNKNKKTLENPMTSRVLYFAVII